MKHSITKKLIVYFSSLLLLFAITVGISFSFLFSVQAKNIYKSDMEKRAYSIGEALSSYSQNSIIGNKNGQVGYRAYIKMLDDIAMSDVWIVDKKTHTISVSTGKADINYDELPDDAVKLVRKIFNGEIPSSDDFVDMFGKSSIFVGTPIYDKNNNVVAAVLLHSDLSEVNSTDKVGIQILLVTLCTTLFAGFIMVILLSKKLTRPLKQMEQATSELINGNYFAKTQVKQQDEIGLLAQNIDVLAQKLKLAEKESQALEQMRKDYISNISHELRTPVTVIRGSIEALCDGVVTEPENVKKYYQEMLSESVYLERLVNDLLELSRMQNPDFSIEKNPLNLIDVLSNAIRTVQHIATEKQIKILYEGNQNVFMIDGDYGRLRQMLIIILDNAVKFSKEGQNVSVKFNSDGNGFSISITDNGIGISPKDLPHIFERFYKTSDPENKKGTGLGLAIAKQISQRHDIDLTAISELNVETTFLLQRFFK